MIEPWGTYTKPNRCFGAAAVFASAAPRNDLRFELEQANASWPIAEHPGTYGGNLARLLAEVAA